MSPRTIYEVRTLVKIDGFAEIAFIERYDELQSDVARIAFDRECKRAKQMVGHEKSYATYASNEISGIVRRVCVEMSSAKVDGGAPYARRVVDSTDTEAGCSYFVTDRSTPAASVETVREMVGASVGGASNDRSAVEYLSAEAQS